MKLRWKLVAFVLCVAIAAVLPFFVEGRATRAACQYALTVKKALQRSTEGSKRVKSVRRRGHIAALRNNRGREPRKVEHLHRYHLGAVVEDLEHQHFVKKLKEWYAKTMRPSN